MVGVNPSFARRGRKAETERQDAQQASSPSGVADHLPPLLTRLFSSSSADQANNQTYLLTKQDSHRNTTLRAKTLRGREREGERGGGAEPRRRKNIPYPQTSGSHMGGLEVCVSCALSLCSSLSFFHGRGGGSARVCVPCVSARELACVCVRAELLKADFSSP